MAETSMAILEEGPILLYDGECGVCNRAVSWVLRHETRKTLRFAALQSELGAQLTAQAKLPKGVDSLVWVEQSEAGVRLKYWSAAVLSTLRYVGGPWRFLRAFWVLPEGLLDAAYRLFARHRLKVAPRSCFVPTPKTRARFLAT